MSTLRVSNIEAKADPSSPSVDEKLKFTNSNGDVLFHLDGKTSGITTVGVNTTSATFSVDNNQNVEFLGIVTATKFSLSGGGEITGGDANFTGIVTAGSISVTGNVSVGGTLTYEDVTSIDSIGIITARGDVHVGAGLSVVGVSTLGNTIVGGATTELVVTGNTRVDGSLIVGSASSTTTTTIDGSQDFPTIRPTLDLNFAATKTLDRRITFTRDSIGTYTDELGIVRTAPNNVPRFDHDPVTGESLGLLIEEQRTNRFSNSTTYAGTGWNLQSPNGVTTNTTEVLSPVGDYTATKWQPTASTVQYIYAGTDGALGTSTYTMSVWVRTPTGESTTFTMNLYAPSQSPGAAAFTATDTWQRFSWTFTAQNQTTAYPVIVEQLNKILYIWGPQIEAGSFPTSYIPTSGSTVTRAADIAKITGTNFTDFYNSSGGTLVSHYDSRVDDNYISTLELSSNPSDNRIALVNFSSYQGLVRTGGSNVASLDNGTPTVGGSNKVALAFKASDFAVSLNGGSPVANPSGTLPTVDRLLIGSRAGLNILNSTIKQLTYYNKRLTNSQLQSLTRQ